ncbi:MAG: hypothetical protein JST12_18650 [Armatimonadetes bacterium]|nr:hypothetical protein [Armatimonadota bacterium]
MSAFDDLWNQFANSWQLLEGHVRMVNNGIDAYRKNFRDQMLPVFQSYAGKGFIAVNVPAALRIPVTSGNAIQIADAYVETYTQNLNPMQDSLNLVLAHSVFEAVMIQLAQASLDALTDIEFYKLHGDKQVKLTEVKDNNAIASVREKLKRRCQNGSTLDELAATIVSSCAERDATLTKQISDAYKPSLDELREVDTLRQSVVHHLNFALSPDLPTCIGRMVGAARYHGHLFANVMEARNINYISHQFESTGAGIHV